MKEQFVTYEIALKLKELGFDDICFCIYNRERSLRFNNMHNPKDRYKNCKLAKNNGKIPAPLWQQAIDWLRINGLSIIFRYYIPESYAFTIQPTFEKYKHISGGIFDRSIYDAPDGYYIAREQAILKAIELCQNKK